MVNGAAAFVGAQRGNRNGIIAAKHNWHPACLENRADRSGDTAAVALRIRGVSRQIAKINDAAGVLGGGEQRPADVEIKLSKLPEKRLRGGSQCAGRFGGMTWVAQFVG